MESVPPAPAPGSMTVPPLFGWEVVLTVLLVVVVLALAYAMVLTSRPGSSGRSDWQAWLDARPSRRSATGDDPATDPTGPAA